MVVLNYKKIVSAVLLPAGVLAMGFAVSEVDAKSISALRQGAASGEYVNCNDSSQNVQAVAHGLNSSESIVCYATDTAGTTQTVACPSTAVKHRAGIGLGMDWGIGAVQSSWTNSALSPYKTWAVRRTTSTLCEAKTFNALSSGSN
jgi:VCBS repeat-containing protein